jgi:hypothetical protein
MLAASPREPRRSSVHRGACSQCSRHPPENLAEARFTGGPAHNARGIPRRTSPKLGSPGGSDLNQTLLLNKLRDKNRDIDLEEFYRSKVNYINNQQLAFLNICPIMYCDFHSFDGKVFKISHPDPYFVAKLNATFRSAYYKTLTLWIDNPVFKVEFIERETVR